MSFEGDQRVEKDIFGLSNVIGHPGFIRPSYKRDSGEEEDMRMD